jgi:Domain of unknown function (DUF5658)
MPGGRVLVYASRMLPPVGRQRSLFGDLVLLAFFAAQFTDGALTYIGVQHFGLGIEANPIVRWYIAVLGIGYALLAVKGVALVCGAVLHLTARHRVVGLLTILYLAMAVRPWVHLLATID